jgi:hypothetical protein
MNNFEIDSGNILKDKFYYLFLIVSGSAYIMNVFLFNELHKCKDATETQTLLFKFDTFIKFMIYCSFIYLLSSYRNLTEDNVSKILFSTLTLLIIVFIQLIPIDMFDILSNMKMELNFNLEFGNILDILKKLGLLLLLILFLSYNFYNAWRDGNKIYLGKLLVICLVILLYITLNIIEPDTINVSGCDDKPSLLIKQKIDINKYFIVFMLIFLISKDKYYISIISFSILFGIFIEDISRLGLPSNVHMMIT